MTHVAFEPKEGVEVVGGSCAGLDGRTHDFAELLKDTENGNVEGVIVTAEDAVIQALDASPKFKRASVPDGYSPPDTKAPEPEVIDLSVEALEKRSRNNLVALAKELSDTQGVTLALEVRPTRGEMVTDLRAQLVREGILNEDGTPAVEGVTA